MDQKHRDLISSNYQELIQLINFDSLVPALEQEKIFTNPMLEDIMTLRTEIERKKMLLDELPTRGPYAFQKFVKALKLSKNIDAAKLLDPHFQLLENLGGPVPNEVRTKGVISADLSSYFVKPAKEWKFGENVYKMSSTPRGRCLLINNVEFLASDMRIGSDLDATRLESIFTQLGYDVTVERNLKGYEMVNVAMSFSKGFEHQEVDSCVVIILSHGEKGCVFGSDEEHVPLDEIYMWFNNYNCPWLQKKPKLFFIQACRGKRPDIGVEFSGKFESIDAAPFRKSIPKVGEKVNKMPTETDILISFSTVEGYVSVRDHIFGSWYCFELALALCEHAHEYNLLEMLKVVDRKVQQRCSQDGEKQATSVDIRGFNKSFYFNPRLTEDSVMTGV